MTGPSVIGLSLADKIIAVHGALDGAGLPHAFGGALALAWCTQRARGTIDIDVNVFVPATDAEVVLAALPGGVAHDHTDLAAVARRRPDPAVVGHDADRRVPRHDAVPHRRRTARPHGTVRRPRDPVPVVPRPRGVQGILRPFEGLGRPRGDGGGGHARHRGAWRVCSSATSAPAINGSPGCCHSTGSGSCLAGTRPRVSATSVSWTNHATATAGSMISPTARKPAW